MRPYDVITTGRWMREALPYVTIAVGNETEVEVAIGESAAETAAARLLELGVELAIVRRGAQGVLAATRSSVIKVPPVRLKVLNGLAQRTPDSPGRKGSSFSMLRSSS